MKRFVRLFHDLDATRSTEGQLSLLVSYFAATAPADAVWTVWLLTARRMKPWVAPDLLRDSVLSVCGYPGWLVERCQAAVGDLAETVTLLLEARPGAGDGPGLPLHVWMEKRLLPLTALEAVEKRRAIESWWPELDRAEALVVNKLLTGRIDLGVSRRLVSRALAEVTDVSVRTLAERLARHWTPTAEFYRALMAPEGEARAPGDSS